MDNVVGSMLQAQAIVDTADIKKVILARLGTQETRRRRRKKKDKQE